MTQCSNKLKCNDAYCNNSRRHARAFGNNATMQHNTVPTINAEKQNTALRCRRLMKIADALLRNLNANTIHYNIEVGCGTAMRVVLLLPKEPTICQTPREGFIDL